MPSKGRQRDWREKLSERRNARPRKRRSSVSESLRRDRDLRSRSKRKLKRNRRDSKRSKN